MGRPDGRAFNQLRRVALRRGVMKFAEASCLVEWGDTQVICTATVQEQVPPPRQAWALSAGSRCSI